MCFTFITACLYVASYRLILRRWEKYGPELFQLRDRNDKSFCLAPTHEELVTAYVSTQLCSYKQLPVKLYQIEKKFRDELRPAYGLYRSREFLMKDLYCFDRNSESALATYNIIKQTYLYIMKNLGLVSEFVPAKPDLMGETTSHELVTEFHAGRQKLVTCERCSSTTFFGKEDVCVVCKSKMRMWNGVEVGHLFLLSSSYVDSFSCHFVDESGVRQPPIMSCYGLGISRLLAVLADIYSDSEGYRFPLSIVPYKVAITHYGQKKDDIAIFENLCISVCNRLLAALPDLVDEVIVDDRHYMNPSQKIADLRGLGFPVIVALGREMLRSGQEAVEVRLRRDRRKIYIPFDALDTLVEVVRREVVV
ncbi:proline--tRNA ligase-like isoform X2 [Zophobas morio]|uniref:proline--tRNA ligase-like isoform X2 n=1 Tax=Zophobas morio TaxID=2755281 RepID=UPI003083EC1B